jgi:phosphoribosylanthranilate isomerase
MTWTKICGITNLDDALNAVNAGADAVGFVFYEKSPRKTEAETVRKIVERLPGRIEKVGVFVNQSEISICALADQAELSAVQLHGDHLEPHGADLILKQRPHLKIIVGISMHHPKPESYALMWRGHGIHAFLVDAADSSNYGGGGKAFNWEQRRPNIEAVASVGRVVVAGGLNPGNVAEALRVLKPWGVDVASGVEAAPGEKDPHKVRAFVAAVRQAEGRS